MIAKITSNIRSINIKKRLVLSFLLTSSVPLLIISIIFFQIHSTSMRDKISTSTIRLLSLVNTNMVTEIEKYQYLCGSICVNEYLIEALKSDSITDGEKNKIVLNIQNTIRSMIIYPAHAKNIMVLDKSGGIFYDLGYDGLYEEDIEIIIADIEERAPEDSWIYVKTYSNRDTIVLSRRIYNRYNTKEVLGYTLIYIDEKLFSKTILAAFDTYDSANTFILNDNGVVLSSLDRNVTPGEPFENEELYEHLLADDNSTNGSFEMSVNGVHTLIAYFYNKNINKYFISTIPFSYINSEANAIIEKIIFTFVIVALLCTGIVVLIYFSITLPIRKMTAICQKISIGEMEERIQDNKNDELAYLSTSIDNMLNQIQQLIEKEHEDEKLKRQLEIQMLQYQINPHFLFNTLNTLRFVAQMNKDTVVSDGITALGELLRNTLVDKNEFISIDIEIKNLKNYFSIQEIRYIGNFTVDYDLEDSLLQCPVPKFILQPLAENSIMHGQRNNGTILKIIVRCYKVNHCIILEIQDNGKGFDTSDSKQSNKGLAGIGISNVRDRIKLCFGSAYGLYITSEINKGTLCKITLPEISNE